MKQERSPNFTIVAFILAAGMALSGYLLSFTIYRSQVANDVVSVKGLAEKEVKADWAQVKVYLSRSLMLSKQEYDQSGQQVIVPKLYKEIEADHKIIKSELLALGIAEDEVGDIVLWTKSEDFRGEDGQHTDTKVVVTGSILVESTKVKTVKQIDGAMSRLMSKGITASTGTEKYHFSKLNDIKPEMIREAMAAARVAANELAGNTGVKLGRIKSANQGRFSIVDKGENYGDTDRIDKKVRVVTEIKFYLEN